MLNNTLAQLMVPSATPEPLIISAEQENRSDEHESQLQSLSSSQQHPLSFLLVPIILILGVALFSGVAIYCIQRRRRLDNLRHTLIPLYTFNKEDEEEWGVLLDHFSNTDQNSGKYPKSETIGHGN